MTPIAMSANRIATSAGAASETSSALPSPNQKHQAARDQGDTGNIHHKLIDAKIHTLMKHGVVRRATKCRGCEMLDRNQRRADEEDEETAEEQHMGETCGSTAPYAPLQNHVAHEAADHHPPIDFSAFLPSLPPKPHAARNSVNPKTDRRCSHQIERDLRPTRHIAEDLPSQLHGSRRRYGLSGRHGRHDSATSR